MQPQSIVFCAYDSPDGRLGGPIAWALDFIPYLNEQYPNFTSLVLCDGGAETSQIYRECKAQGIDCHVLDTSQTCYLEDQVQWILQQAVNCDCQALIANLVLPALYASSGLRSGGIPSIGVLHSDPDYDPFYRDYLETFVAGRRHRLGHLVCVSDALKSKADALGSGTPTSSIACGTKKAEEFASPPDGKLRLMYAGRLVEKAKRIRATVEAMLQAVQEIEEVEFSIFGDGDQCQWVQQRVASQQRVQYRGSIPVADLQSEMLQHHGIVMLSDFEGLPIALVEAMARGLVPIGLKDTPGVNEVVTDGDNGLLIKDRQHAFVSAVRRLTDVSCWQPLSEHAIQSTSQRYTHDVTFARWADLLGELCSGSKKDTARVAMRMGRLNDRGGLFSDYAPSRPSTPERFLLGVSQGWFQLRQTLRPRARLRALFGK